MSYTLLETVNYVISQTGAAPVDSLNDALPDVASALLRINEARIQTIKTGLWFNTGYNTTIYPVASRFPVSAETIKIVKSSPRFVIPRNGYLYDPHAGTDTFPDVTEFVIDSVIELDYDDLPYAAQDVIRVAAARQHILLELEDAPKADALGVELTALIATMRQEDAEIRRHNLEDGPTLRADEERKKLLKEGWWFNTEYGATITKDGDNKFPVDPDTLKILKVSPGFLVERGGFLYDLNKQTDVFPTETVVTVDRVVDLPITSVPQAARDIVRLRADREERMKELIVMSQQGDAATIERGGARITGIQADIQIAYEILRKDDQDYRRFNLEEGASHRQNEERIKVLKRGWWFNTEIGVTITKDGDDKYPVPEGTIKVLRSYPQILVERNGFLYSTYENTDVFPDEDAEICVDVVLDVPFAQLPASVQDVVRISCEREYTMNILKDKHKVKELQADLLEAQLQMNKDDLEIRRHHTTSNPKFIKTRGGVRPYRTGGRSVNPTIPGG